VRSPWYATSYAPDVIPKAGDEQAARSGSGGEQARP
jgi:hypothetical protein